MDADRTPTRGGSRRMLAVAAAAVVTGAIAVALSTERRPAPPPAIVTGVAKRPLSATSGLRPRRALRAAGCHPTCRGGERADPAQHCAATCR